MEQEEVSRLRCQTISSIRRECRRDSNEFFRLSMTGRDLFDAAEKDRTNEGAELKSEELVEKVLQASRCISFGELTFLVNLSCNCHILSSLSSTY